MSKDIVLFVNAIRPATFSALKEHEAQTGQHLIPVVIVHDGIKDSIMIRNGQHGLPEEVTVISANFDSANSIREALSSYMDRVYAVTSQYENCVLELQKLVPYFPYLPMPTESSLNWGTEKKLMRTMLESHDRSLIPNFIEVSNYKSTTLDRIEKAISYPMIVKPSGLEGSLLVTRVNNRKQLETTLKRTFTSIQASYDEWVKRQTPVILVEEFMVGKKYVIDTYGAADGTCYHNPVITSLRGIEAGFDDFFEYKASLPPELSDTDIRDAQDAAERAIHALGFRSVTADIELMHTKHGWQIIELTARMGGYCHDMYYRSYGINHIMNDILNRAGEKPIIPTKLKKCIAIFEIYAKEEGILSDITGLDEVKALPSFVHIHQNIKIGEPALFAKHGGDWVFDIILSHSDKTQLAIDTEVLERVLKLHVTHSGKAASTPAKKLVSVH